jgi:hypothetical protein
MSRDAKIGLLVVFASITLGLFLGFTEVMDREYIKVNGKNGGDGSEFNEEPVSGPQPANDEWITS